MAGGAFGNKRRASNDGHVYTLAPGALPTLSPKVRALLAQRLEAKGIAVTEKSLWREFRVLAAQRGGKKVAKRKAAPVKHNQPSRANYQFFSDDEVVRIRRMRDWLGLGPAEIARRMERGTVAQVEGVLRGTTRVHLEAGPDPMEIQISQEYHADPDGDIEGYDGA